MNEIVWSFTHEHGFGAYEADFGDAGISLTPTSATPTATLAPGFIDQHIHGGFGIDYMSASSSEILKWADELERRGYEGFLPTTVTCTPSDARSAIEKLPEDPRILGFHLEGPFISPAFPGAQPPSLIVPFPEGASEWDFVLNHPKLKVITVAPELPNAPARIKKLSDRGVKVGIGHTNACFAEAQAGQIAGASHATHTFNAMKPFHHREAGTVGFVLEAPNLLAELIYDRIHVCRDSAALLVQCKGNEGIIAVSDATMAAGMAPGKEFKMWGLDVVTGEKQVRLKSGALAGSAITLLDAFQNVASDFGVEAAIRTTSINPRRNLGLKGSPTHYSLFDRKFELQSVFKNGKPLK